MAGVVLYVRVHLGRCTCVDRYIVKNKMSNKFTRFIQVMATRVNPSPPHPSSPVRVSTPPTRELCALLCGRETVYPYSFRCCNQVKYCAQCAEH